MGFTSWYYSVETTTKYQQRQLFDLISFLIEFKAIGM